MKLKDIYRTAVEESIKQDPRGKDAVAKELKEKKDAFEKLDVQKRKEFDKEELTNPYADSRILYGDPDKDIQGVLVGIDMDASEIILADWINFKNKKKTIDLCLSHHPEGCAWASFYEVMGMQAAILAKFGVPINIGEGLLQERMAEVSRRVHAANHNKTLDAARLLGIPLMCLHTVADNFAASYIQSLIDKNKPEKVEDVMSILKGVPEYQLASKDKAGPKIILGDAKHKTGKIIVEMTGGTEGHRDIFENYIQAGIGTIIAMHLSEEHFQKAKGKQLNIIIAGHIASDNIGVNLLLDKIQQKDKLTITECSGFRRVKR